MASKRPADVEEDDRLLKKTRISSGIASLHVGSSDGPRFHKARTITVNKDILTKTSRFFRTALEKGLKEDEINMPEDSPYIVERYIEWLDSGKILEPSNNFGLQEGAFCLLNQFYVFGEQIQDDSYCNAVIGAYAKHIDFVDSAGLSHSPVSWAVDQAYEGTTFSSPLRKLVVDCWVSYADTDWWFREHPYRPKNTEFLEDLVMAFIRHQTDPDPIPYGGAYQERERWFK